MARFSARGRRHSFFATAILILVAVAPLALASQGGTSDSKAKKKGPKAAASASASASASATPAEEPTPSATAEPEPAPTETTTPPEAGTASVAATDEGDDITNVVEDPTKTYHYVGVRYRGTVIPAFLEHLFVRDGGTFYSNSIGAEIDFRKAEKSTILWLQYTEYGFGDTLFFQKGVTDEPNNYSIVSSSLKGIYAGIDEVWSTPLANHLDLDYGFGLGLGVLFGNITNDWVWSPSEAGVTAPPGSIKGDNGQTYAKCNSQTDGVPVGICSTSSHQNASTAKVDNYQEPNWFNGGAVPVIFPHIAGQIGLRYKPIKQLQTRLDLGIALTGFWFGLSADYGIESSEETNSHPASTPPSKDPAPSSATSRSDSN
jgi:hypothetical protein